MNRTIRPPTTLGLVVVVALCLCCGACGDNRIPAWAACAEQADAWCAAIGYPGTGCEIVYNHRCAPGDSRETIDSGDQDACLDAIAELQPGPLGYVVPAECTATWFAR